MFAVVMSAQYSECQFCSEQKCTRCWAPAPVLNALPPDHAAAGACTTIGFFTFLGRLLLFCSLLDIFESYAAISDVC